MEKKSPKIMGFVGRSGMGKTTLLTQVVPIITATGLTVNVIKHSHHDIELEPPEKDSYRFRQAGATEVVVSSPFRFAMIHELRDGEAEPSLDALVARMAPVDVTLVEGFKRDDHPKIEVFRAHQPGVMPLYPVDVRIIAVATDGPLPADLPAFRGTLLDINDPDAVAAFVWGSLSL